MHFSDLITYHEYLSVYLLLQYRSHLVFLVVISNCVLKLKHLNQRYLVFITTTLGVRMK